jgi:hypothetical protein
MSMESNGKIALGSGHLSAEQLIQRGIAPVKAEYLAPRRHAARGTVAALGGQASTVVEKKSKKQIKKVSGRMCSPRPPGAYRICWSAWYLQGSLQLCDVRPVPLAAA